MEISTIKRYARISYPLVTAAIFLAAAIAGIWGVFRPSGPEHNPGFLGRWESTYQYLVPLGLLRFQGTTEFLRNGHYNVLGTIEISGMTEDRPFEYSIPVRGAGKWMADDEYLTFTLTDMRADPGRYKIGKLDIPIPALEQITGIRAPDFNKQYLPGGSGEVKIISQEERKMVLEGQDPSGKPFTYLTTRHGSLLNN